MNVNELENEINLLNNKSCYAMDHLNEDISHCSLNVEFENNTKGQCKKEIPNMSINVNTSKRNLWSKIALKFRFIQHFMKKTKEKRSREQINNLSMQKLDKYFDKYVNVLDSDISHSELLLRRSASSRSYVTDTRRIKSESEKDHFLLSTDLLTLQEFFNTKYLETYSYSQLNCPLSIKEANKGSDYLLIVNSDNETIESFNKNEKKLTTLIDIKLNSKNVRSPFDIVRNNSNRFFITDWLNDEIIMYNEDIRQVTSISNFKNFSSPSGLDLDFSTEYLYVCNSGKNTIEIFDSRLEHFKSFNGEDVNNNSNHNSTTLYCPKWIINSDCGFVAISCFDSNEIKLFDKNNLSLIRTIKDCYSPESITFSDCCDTQLFVLSSSSKNIIKAYDILSGKLIKVYDYFNEEQNLCSLYGLKGLCCSNKKLFFTDCIKNRIFICNT